MGFLQGKLMNSVLYAAPWHNLLLGEAVFAGSPLLMYQTCLGKRMKQEPERSHDSPMIVGIPVCVNCGAFFKGTSTVAVRDWICKTCSEMSIHLKEKMKHLQCCICLLLVIFKQVIFSPSVK